MSELTIWTYDWVPEGARGFVRDLRLRWACEEARLPYAVQTVPFDGRETNHLARQPFGQVPFLSDGELEIFESGAGLLHLSRKSDKLMPRDRAGEDNALVSRRRTCPAEAKISVVSTQAPLDFARGKLRAARRDLLAPIGRLSWTEGLSARACGPRSRRREGRYGSPTHNDLSGGCIAPEYARHSAARS